MDGLDFERIAKWVLVVFATGVIAGFGKLLAQWIVKRRRRSVHPVPVADGSAPAATGPAEDAAPAASQPGDPVSGKIAKSAAKAAKKAAKQEQKTRKKQVRGGE